ncbi:terpenoid synthase [Daedaleopsis nitida]|nr:terpenoid synthase [Daedaleopsis nitida]
MRDFLQDISYKPMGTIPNLKLRQETRDEILSWNATDLSPAFIDGLTDTAVSMAEFGCSHTSYEHQRYVAFYTAYLVVADDLGQYNLEAIGQFARRLTCGQPQLHLALDRLVVLLRTTHDLYPRVSADAIIANTLDALSWMFVEVQTKYKAVLPAASRYPHYIRCKVGVAAGYSHFCFMKHWADNAETGLFYLQSIPDLEVITVFANDILSFYKEALARENDNYIHLRAAAEQKPVIQVLREVVEETVESTRKLAELGAVQPGLAAICNDYIMGYIDFHFAAKRYRLQDLEI